MVEWKPSSRELIAASIDDGLRDTDPSRILNTPDKPEYDNFSLSATNFGGWPFFQNYPLNNSGKRSLSLRSLRLCGVWFSVWVGG
jgi:hypothetical protein